MPETGMVRRNR